MRKVTAISIVASAAVVALGLAACSATPETPGTPSSSLADTDEEAGGAPTSITIAQGISPANLNPLQDETRAVMSVYSTIFETLTVIDSDHTLQPLLATEWEQVDDLTWRFHLREGVEYSDGEPFTAEAVRFTIARIQDPEQQSTKLARFANVDTATVVDDYTVDITTKAPMPLLPNELSQLYIVPPQYSTEFPDKASTEPVGTGAYVLGSYTPGEEVVVTANPDYWGEPAPVDEITWRAIPDESARIAALQTGEVDLISAFTPDQVPVLEASGLTVEAGSSGLGMVLTMNTLDGPFADLRVRQAATLAVNAQEIVENLLGSYGTVLDGQLVNSTIFGYNPDLSPVQQDVDEARALLAEAGYADGVTVTMQAPSGRYTNDRQVAEAVAGQLEAAGFDVELTVQEYQPFLEAVRAKQTDLHLIAWYATPLFDASNALTWFTSGSVYSYWQNVDFDAALATAAATSDSAVREEAFHEATQIMADEAPGAFLYDSQTLYAFDDTLAGWTPRDDDLISFRDLHGE